MLGNYKRQDDCQFYFVGGGLGCLTGAAYLLRDCGFEGKDIHIIEALPVAGGSNDACGDPEHGWICRGERMFNKQTYENFWDIMSSIPSLTNPGNSVTDDMFEFSSTKPCKAKARLLDADGEIMDSSSYGLNKQELKLVLSLFKADENELDDLTIEDWFGVSPHFFKTPFWYIYEGTFALQPWSSVIEFKRYLTRFFHLITRINTASGVTLTRNSQFESIITPLLKVLMDAGVDFVYNTVVTDMDFADGDGITVTGLHVVHGDKKDYIKLNENDKVIVTLGCMTDNATFGNAEKAAGIDDSYPMSANLWKNIAAKKPVLGNPDKFFAHPDKSKWMTFNCTFHGNTFMDWMEKYTHNKTGEGLLTSFTGSPWHMELRIPLPPYFENQPEDYSFLWMCAFYTDEPGRFTGKPEYECTGLEILDEILMSLPMDDDTRQKCRDEVVAAIPVMLPYTNAHFLARSAGDRPDVVPEGSTNLGFTGQYCEIPEDCVFTEEYSVRAARMAVYKLLGMKRDVCPVKPIQYDVRIILAALVSYLK